VITLDEIIISPEFLSAESCYSVNNSDKRDADMESHNGEPSTLTTMIYIHDIVTVDHVIKLMYPEPSLFK